MVYVIRTQISSFCKTIGSESLMSLIFGSIYFKQAFVFYKKMFSHFFETVEKLIF